MDEIAETGPAVIDKWAERISEAAASYGPEAAELALVLGQIGAAQALLKGVVLAVAALVAARGSRWLFQKGSALRESSHMDEHFPAYAAFALTGAASFMLACGSAAHFLNIYAWIGLFRPEVFLAAKALGL